jgi:hypothetical protein
LAPQTNPHFFVKRGSHQCRAVPVDFHRLSRSSLRACRTLSRSNSAMTMVRPRFLITRHTGTSAGRMRRKTTRSSSTDSSRKTSPGEKRSGNTARLRESNFRVAATDGNFPRKARLVKWGAERATKMMGPFERTGPIWFLPGRSWCLRYRGIYA